jgi:aldose 1-epimerase
MIGRTTKTAWVSAAMLATTMLATTAQGATARREAAGALPDGTKVEAITLTGTNGVSAKIITYGATLLSLMAPDRQGKSADVLIGYDGVDGYLKKPDYFGVTVGRFANRIGKGRFTLDGKTYQLPLNDKVNTLHGGTDGFSRKPWKIVSVKDGAQASVVLALTSPDGDQGYPGTFQATVTYSLDDAGALTIKFEGKTDKPTVVNMTNHAIFNLGGEGSALGVLNHKLTMPASAITPVDDTLIPTGELRPVAGTVFDFRQPRVIGDGLRDGRDPQIVAGRGYDHNFALDKGLTASPQLAARLEDPVSGRVLEVLTTEPGVQIYSGNFLDGTVLGKNGHMYRMGDGLALEPQKFPDAPNKPSFVSARVDPGKPYSHTMVYRMSVAK